MFSSSSVPPPPPAAATPPSGASSTSSPSASPQTSASSALSRGVEGRYAEALFNACQDRGVLDKVAADLTSLRACVQESEDLAVFIATPSVPRDEKMSIFKELASKQGFDELTVNYMNVLTENGRLPMFEAMVEAFEELYRAAKGRMKCVVTSARSLSDGDRKKVLAALQKRMGPDMGLDVEYDVQPAIMGGLRVKFDEQILDFSVASRLERLTAMLRAPLGDL